MPEIPDLTIYLEALEVRTLDTVLTGVRLTSPFVLRTVDPPLDEVRGRRVVGVRRIGKRLVIELEGELYLVIHLMVAGRLRWAVPGAEPPRRMGLAALDFASGTLILTEASSHKRASISVVRGVEALTALDRGGLEPLQADATAFAAALRRERHTLKRGLTDPRLFAGIGNAYSDEILHRARLSPLQITTNLDDAEVARLHSATRQVLTEWIGKLRTEAAGEFPKEVTAFREGMAVHGRYRLPCPTCGSPVRRIVYAENECNYCATCQTGGRVLSDRSLSRLLK